MRSLGVKLVSVAAGALFVACATAEARSPDDVETCPVTIDKDPEYRADIELICQVDERAELAALDPLEAAQKRDDYLVEHVKNPDVIEFLTVFRSKPDKERAELLADRARVLGLKACPLRDLLASR